MKFATNAAVVALVLTASVVASPLASAASNIVQGPPSSGATDVAGSAGYTDFLTAASGATGTVTFTTSMSGFAIVGDNELESTGTLSASGSPYAITGSDTDADAYGDSGTWSYILTVTPDTIVQGSPTSGSTSTTSSTAFTDTLEASSGFVGPVTFVTPTTGFTISNDDELETTGPLNAGSSPYTITGTDSDAYGDSGTWSYSLTVTPASGGGSEGGTTSLIQASFTSGSVSASSSGTFTAGPITVEGNVGPVTFVTTSSSSSLTASSSGSISTTGPLSVGSYMVSGTDSDTNGDTGTWTYTLSVIATAVITVTFDGNGGSGVITPESESAPTALSLNGFVRKGYTFVDWNTKANGSGLSYANGAIFPFVTATTLFAQWKRGKSPLRTITFASNRGTGATVSEIEDTPTAIRPNHFTRSEYTFVDWNTRANGSAMRFKPGATYPFKRSITLYAQWKKTPKAPTKPPPKAAIHVVTFAANGGVGAMAAESHRSPTTLKPNHFTRKGYTFVDWNTKAHGSGASYGFGATFSFAASTTLYAQWKKNKVIPPTPPIPGGVIIGPFALGSSSLTSGLESQIQSLAGEAKTKGEKQITLYGFGDASVSSETNTQLGRARAVAVATYLEARLAAIGLKGWTISFALASPSPSEVSTVVATFS